MVPAGQVTHGIRHHFAFVDIAVGFDPPSVTAPSGGRRPGPSYFEDGSCFFFRPARPGLSRPGRARAAAAARNEDRDETTIAIAPLTRIPASYPCPHPASAGPVGEIRRGVYRDGRVRHG
jgi:hypothetical protein